MSQITQVIHTARALQIAGKTPSIALLKNKLKSIPMPLLIQGLQQFKAMSQDELNAISLSNSEDHLTPEIKSQTDEINQLKQKITQLELAYQKLAARLDKLEQ